MELLSERLQWSLKQSGQTQAALAAAVGVSKSTVSQWCADSTANLKMANLFNAARFLEVQPEWLATGEGSRRANTADQEAEELARAITRLSPAARDALRTLIGEIADDA